MRRPRPRGGAGSPKSAKRAAARPSDLIIGVQAGLAAALAWLLAQRVLGTAEPTFAPGSAVTVIAASIGNQARRTSPLMAHVGALDRGAPVADHANTPACSVAPVIPPTGAASTSSFARPATSSPSS
ncbi:hypothetical protein RB614_43755 [Phytohabitans sp. ZYX-F-186]|uniref:Uncharacterized protein n=1 Tax=Phytohabitans maris TaxID=3071409 RepID=A0ABU0ZWV8_9ACTN|nr:hypothetical protein [Phytohabitans sp. ZYX-F-186]MDQ7911425.1 hypothetical protein [Phytohabitans sp. ZYX-F-186]